MQPETIDLAEFLSSEIRREPVFLKVRDTTNVERPVLAWIMVESIETRTYKRIDDDTLAVTKASVTLTYRQVSQGISLKTGANQRFVATYNGREIDMTQGFVVLELTELHGRGVGSYLFNELVIWARQWPSASIKRFSLSPNQAYPGNKDRRNRFYGRFGFRFHWDDPVTREAGSLIPMCAGDLSLCAANAEKIKVLSLRQYLRWCIDNDLRCRFAESEVRVWKRRYDEVLDELTAVKASPLKWALAQTAPRLLRFGLVLGGLLAAIVFVAAR